MNSKNCAAYAAWAAWTPAHSATPRSARQQGEQGSRWCALDQQIRTDAKESVPLPGVFFLLRAVCWWKAVKGT